MQVLKKMAGKMKSATAFRQLSVMMIITTITQFISIYKSAIIAANFGACVELDAYNFANNLSTFFLTFVSSGITTVVIPAYVKKLDRKAIDTFLTVVFSITAVLLLGTFLLRSQLVDLLTSREPEFRTYVSSIMLLTMWIQTLPAVLGVTAAYYQCIGKFNQPKIILLLSNIGSTVVLIALSLIHIFLFAESVVITHKVLYLYDFREGSLSKRYISNMVERKQRLLQEYRKILLNSNLFEQYEEAYYTQCADSYYALSLIHI